MFHDWLITLPGGEDAMLTVERIADFVHARLDPNVTARSGLDESLRGIE